MNDAQISENTGNAPVDQNPAPEGNTQANHNPDNVSLAALDAQLNQQAPDNQQPAPENQQPEQRDNQADNQPEQADKQQDQQPEQAPADFTAEDLGLALEADAGLLAGFNQLGRDLGLSREQMGALARWQEEMCLQQQEQAIASTRKELISAWGRKAESNRQAAATLVARVDQLTNGAFGKALASTGAANNAGVIMGLHALASALGEDAIGNINAAAAPSQEDPMDVFSKVFG